MNSTSRFECTLVTGTRVLVAGGTAEVKDQFHSGSIRAKGTQVNQTQVVLGVT